MDDQSVYHYIIHGEKYYSKTLPLPGFDEKGRQVVIMRSGIHDPLTTTVDQLMRASNAIGGILAEEVEQFTITGFIVISDLAGVNSNHFLQVTPALAKKMMVVTQVSLKRRLIIQRQHKTAQI